MLTIFFSLQKPNKENGKQTKSTTKNKKKKEKN